MTWNDDRGGRWHGRFKAGSFVDSVASHLVSRSASGGYAHLAQAAGGDTRKPLARKFLHYHDLKWQRIPMHSAGERSPPHFVPALHARRR
ncbi:hypothetical protein [Aureliella helgolandensis]|uniref:hypothetical protein n=1 Tax=Aureliella helgolandensis TaxID=2527968 RepID=UPI0011A1C94B|nr:hypothetical protein [Aureliella helgolandensis]